MANMSKKRATSFENIFVSETHRVIYNEISYLKKRIHLVEGERKANYESNEETLKHQENQIKDIRRKNQDLKGYMKELLSAKDPYFKLISSKFGSDRKAYEFREKSYEDTLDILECKIGTLVNKLNALKYRNGHKENQLKGFLQKESDLKAAFNGKRLPQGKESPLHKRKEGIKMVETATAAMQMKITEADNIRSRYKQMVAILKSENFSLNTRVKEQERKIGTEKSEIEKTQSALQEAVKAKKQAKLRLAEIEEKTIQDYSEREKQLYEARMQLKLIREKMDQIGSKLSFPKFHIIHRDSSITDGLYAGYKIGSDHSETKAQNLVETVYNKLATMVGESDPSIIVTRFQEQRVHAKELLVQEDAAKSAVRKAKLRKRFLVDKLSQLQYSGGLKREKLNVKFNEIHVTTAEISSEREKLDSWLHDHHNAMDQMQTKLTEIFRVNDIKIPPSPQVPGPEIPAQNVAYLLKLLLKYLDKILGASDGTPYSPMTPALLTPQAIPQDDQQQQISASSLASPMMMGGEFDFPIGNPLGESTSSLFGLPTSPAGSSTASYRYRGSLAGLDGMPILGGGEGSEIFPFDNDILTLSSDHERAPSLVVPEGPLLGSLSMGEGTEDRTGKREDIAGMKVKGLTRRGESSEEEEAVTRNFVKRQSQILFEAKTRKGRFNTAITMNVRNRKY